VITVIRRVPARYVALYASHLHGQGVDTQRLLRMAGIRPSTLEQFDAMLLPEQIERFIAAAFLLTQRSDLGFECGRLIHMTSHGILGYGMLSCQTPDQAWRLASRYYHLRNALFTMRCRRTLHHYEVIYSPVAAMPRQMLYFLLELTATAHENQFRAMLGNEVEPYDIYLAMPPPPHRGRYAELSPVRFHFDEHAMPGLRVVIRAALADTPMPMPSLETVRAVKERCEQLSSRPTPANGGWGDYVAMMLRGVSGPIGLNQIAARLHVSQRTIERHLKKEELLFRDLAQQVCFERACEMLAGRGSTVAQIAERLGFSDTANFSRAFRRFVGVSPSQYQQQGVRRRAT
jgi:AraC-like DNA-binding protein